MKKSVVLMGALIMATGSVLAGPAELLKKWDADKDGKISKEEFTAMTKAQFESKGKEGYEAEAEKRFKNRDADGDGVLSAEEFMAAPAAK